MLTKPSKPCGNNGYDNEDSDYILYVNDVLGSEGNKYLILDVLGQGTFGQVVKCQNLKTHEIVGVKVIKNKEAYAQQSTMEIMILDIVSQCRLRTMLLKLSCHLPLICLSLAQRHIRSRRQASYPTLERFFYTSETSVFGV